MDAPAATLSPPASLLGPFRLAIGVLAGNALTILKGAMTTSTGSGMAYRDAPLADGQFLPVSSYTTLPGFLEHFHRIAAATTGLLALALALWLQAARLGSRRARVTAWLGGCLLLAQAFLGMFGVWNKLPAANSIAHGLLAQLVFATFAWLAYQLSDRWRDTAPLTAVAPGSGRGLALGALAMLVLQTLLGGVARHTNDAAALWTHAGNSFVVFVVVVIATAFVVGRLGAIPGVRGLARGIVTLLIVQIALGFVALLVRNSAGKTPANVDDPGIALLISVHVLCGALLTVLVATLAAHVFRGTRRPVAAQDTE